MSSSTLIKEEKTIKITTQFEELMNKHIIPQKPHNSKQYLSDLALRTVTSY